MEQFCHDHSIITGLIFVAYSFLEFWLGKTKSTESSSVIEFLINLVLHGKK